MIKSFKLVKIDYKYCEYLRKYDNKVSYNKGLKELRPFIGILFKIGKIEYFAPLSSPKPKHKLIKKQIDIVKINGGKYGVVNLNNMIPVTNKNYELLDLDAKPKNRSELKRQILLKAQLRYLNKSYLEIKKKSLILYRLAKSNSLTLKLKNRCCDFILLEQICQKYNLEKSQQTKITLAK